LDRSDAMSEGGLSRGRGHGPLVSASIVKERLQAFLLREGAWDPPEKAVKEIPLDAGFCEELSHFRISSWQSRRVCSTAPAGGSLTIDGKRKARSGSDAGSSRPPPELLESELTVLAASSSLHSEDRAMMRAVYDEKAAPGFCSRPACVLQPARHAGQPVKLPPVALAKGAAVSHPLTPVCHLCMIHP
jgi:hypothetical protein